MGLAEQNTGKITSPKLSEVLFERQSHSFRSIAALPSNVESVEAALLFATGLNTHVAIIGPSGWGKSHLLTSVASRLKSEAGEPVELMRAEDFVAHPAKQDVSGALILDDCQELLQRPRPRLLLHCLLERRVRSGKRTLLAFTSAKVSRQIRNFLPFSRDWTIAQLGTPSAEERVLLLNQMATAEGLLLSPSLIRVIASRMHGNGRTLSGALKRLRLTGSSWLDPRSTLQACGLLEPFFADNSSWDLKHRVLRVAEQSRSLFGRVATLDLVVYTLLKEACLSEVDVARFLGMEPASAYLKASRFQRDMERDPQIAAYVSQFVDLVLTSLAHE